MIQYKPWSREVLKELTEQAYEYGFSCLDIELSGECPYNCVYCETPYRRQKAKINIKQICSLISTKQFKWIYICGIGEPTYGTNQEVLLQILSYCKQYGAKCSIFSNLSNLADEFIDFIKEGILYILFKFDTQNIELLKKLYNPNNIDDHLSNIQNIINLVECDGISTNIAASIVPTQENKEEIPNLVKWCIDRNIYPLVAQLEYAGAAKDVYDKLVLNDNQLIDLKENIETVIKEEYRLPFCPSLVAGICITYNNEITLDHRTGLSCHSFWLEDPERDVICPNLYDGISIEEITDRLVAARIERFEEFKNNIREYCSKTEIFGGCGGNKRDVFTYYFQSMAKMEKRSKENNLKINRFVYFDNNATTKVSDAVLSKMRPFLGKQFANPNSKTKFGLKIRNEIESARQIIADVINCHIENIIFTSCGSEANSLAIHSLVDSNPQKKTIISTEIEHDSVLNQLKYLKGKGFKIHNIPIRSSGEIDIPALLKQPPDWNDVCFASVMYVNNETGVINDIEQLVSILREHNIPVHCDAVQAFGKLAIDVKKLGVDYLSISGHKINAPKGIGALFAKDQHQVSPIIYGNQEGEKRGGTENVAYIVGFGEAARTTYSLKHFEDNCQRMQKMRDEMENRIQEEINDVAKITINGKTAPRVSNTSFIGFAGIDALTSCLLLEKRGIQISPGAACENGDPRYSHVLKAMNSPSYGDGGALRISLSPETEQRDVDYLVDNLVDLITNEVQKNKVKKSKGGQ